MRAFKNRNNKTTRNCGYCGESDHVVTTCPHAYREWLEWSENRVPIHKGHASGNYPYKWYLWHTSDYTKWYKNADKAYQKIAAFRERELLRSKGRRHGPTGTNRKCGFCEQAGHSRRNCSTMERVKLEAYQANQNWRRSFYEEFVKKRGLCEGAAVKVNNRKNWQSDEKEAIGLVTSVNWDEISFLTSADRIDWNYRSELSIKVMVDGETKELKLEEAIVDSNGRIMAVGSNYHYYGTARLIEVIGRSEKELDESWVTDGLVDEFDWLTKKRTETKLEEYGILAAIEKWK